jgi:hypothetical protein
MRYGWQKKDKTSLSKTFLLGYSLKDGHGFARDESRVTGLA